MNENVAIFGVQLALTASLLLLTAVLVLLAFLLAHRAEEDQKRNRPIPVPVFMRTRRASDVRPVTALPLASTPSRAPPQRRVTATDVDEGFGAPPPKL